MYLLITHKKKEKKEGALRRKVMTSICRVDNFEWRSMKSPYAHEAGW